jgi:hypothetical protein
MLFTLVWLLIKRLATVSTGWKINSSKIPELPLPRKRAVPDSDFPEAMGGDILWSKVKDWEKEKEKKTNVPGRS